MGIDLLVWLLKRERLKQLCPSLSQLFECLSTSCAFEIKLKLNSTSGVPALQALEVMCGDLRMTGVLVATKNKPGWVHVCLRSKLETGALVGQ